LGTSSTPRGHTAASEREEKRCLETTEETLEEPRKRNDLVSESLLGVAPRQNTLAKVSCLKPVPAPMSECKRLRRRSSRREPQPPELAASSRKPSQMAPQEGAEGPRVPQESCGSHEVAQACSNMLKPGCDRADPARVARVLSEKTAGSAHSREQQRKDHNADLRAEKLARKLHMLGPLELDGARNRVHNRISKESLSRSLHRCVMHCDLDQFFAACEALQQPELRGTPFAVGGMQMISTASYEARAYGVRSAMPGFVAIELCPHLRFVKSNFALYSQKSEEVRDAMREVIGDEPRCFSLDEAYLDCTFELERRQCSHSQLAQLIRSHVKERTGGLTCSVGIAPNARLAKLASDQNKPDGQFEVAFDEDGIRAFLHNLPIRKLNGIGRSSEKMLCRLGISTVGELRNMLPELSLLLYESQFEFLLHNALGLGDDLARERSNSSNSSVGRKGISQEKTFAETVQWSVLTSVLEHCVNKVSQELAEKNLLAGNLTVKAKSAQYRVTQRQRTLSERKTRDKNALLREALKLFRELEEERRGKAEADERLRLLGVRASQLETEDGSVLRDKGQHLIKGMLQKKCKRDDGRSDADYEDKQEREGKEEDEDRFYEKSERDNDRNWERRGEGAAASGKAQFRTRNGGEEEGEGRAESLRDARSAEQQKRCSECGDVVLVSKMQEHRDWHLAQNLKIQEQKAVHTPKKLKKQHKGTLEALWRSKG